LTGQKTAERCPKVIQLLCLIDKPWVALTGKNKLHRHCERNFKVMGYACVGTTGTWHSVRSHRNLAATSRPRTLAVCHLVRFRNRDFRRPATVWQQVDGSCRLSVQLATSQSTLLQTVALQRLLAIILHDVMSSNGISEPAARLLLLLLLLQLVMVIRHEIDICADTAQHRLHSAWTRTHTYCQTVSPRCACRLTDLYVPLYLLLQSRPFRRDKPAQRISSRSAAELR